MKLVLGVVDIPYADDSPPQKVPKAKKGKANKPIKPKAAARSQTTGEVAERLEQRYHVMQHFAEMEQDFITHTLVKEMQGALTNLMLGGPPTDTPLAGACDAIKTKFTEFLNTEAMAHTGEPGVPTRAALEGVNHRLKLSRGPRRPSFVDTHLYRDSMKVWTED